MREAVLVVRTARTACKFCFHSMEPTNRYTVKPTCEEENFILAIIWRETRSFQNGRGADEKAGIAIMSKAWREQRMSVVGERSAMCMIFPCPGNRSIELLTLPYEPGSISGKTNSRFRDAGTLSSVNYVWEDRTTYNQNPGDSVQFVTSNQVDL